MEHHRAWLCKISQLADSSLSLSHLYNNRLQVHQNCFLFSCWLGKNYKTKLVTDCTWSAKATHIYLLFKKDECQLPRQVSSAPSVSSIPLLNKTYRSIADWQELEPIEKWRERVILPRLLSALELLCIKAQTLRQNFESFSEVCTNTLPDPLLMMAFTPVDEPHVSQSTASIHWHVDAACVFGTDTPNETHWVLCSWCPVCWWLVLQHMRWKICKKWKMFIHPLVIQCACMSPYILHDCYYKI